MWYEKKFAKKFQPNTKWVSNSMYKTKKEKEQSLWRHSERYALIYGLIKLRPDEDIIITENLRICGDCHVVITFLSEMLERKIIVRDAKRFHHFENGECSCKNIF